MAIKFGLPVKGVNKGAPHSEVYQEYSPHMSNVRVRDVLAGRLRLGQRPGLAKWGAGTQVGGDAQPVVAMCTIATVES
jgi:hypothetical protein